LLLRPREDRDQKRQTAGREFSEKQNKQPPPPASFDATLPYAAAAALRPALDADI
jgi:hypothetical protein